MPIKCYINILYNPIILSYFDLRYLNKNLVISENINRIKEMIALFVLLQLAAAAKDLIEENKVAGTFLRAESGECYTQSAASWIKTKVPQMSIIV